MANEIDKLMDNIGQILSLPADELTSADLDKQIAYIRKIRGLVESGQKVEKQDLGTLKGSKLLESLKLTPPVEVDRRD